MEIRHHWLITSTYKLTSIQISYGELLKIWHDLKASLNLFFIIESCHEWSPKLGQDLVERLRF